VNPVPSNLLHKFLFLSYPLPSPPGTTTPTQYAKGPSDLLFIMFSALLLTFIRQSLTTLVFFPLALHFSITSPSKRFRFVEQSYQGLYWFLSSLYAMALIYHSPLWTTSLNINMYSTYPNHTLSHAFKFYYLFQASYWVQQAVVVVFKIEKPRKDYWQLVGHHCVTLMLIGLSYRFHFTYMGLAVFVTHDLSDCLFAVSSTLLHILPFLS
jgi:very-long-chain ceramide synthase